MSDSPAATADAQAAARRLDAAAVAAVLRRLARSPGRPWLHGEIARRMAQRLALIRLQPRCVVDWWAELGQGGELLAQAYPKAHFIRVEPGAAWLAAAQSAARQPWWSPGRWLGPTVRVVDESDTLAEPAQLVWANMMLHGVVDPPRLLARWQQLLAADGFVMFSCLGPGTLRELRALYARLGWPSPTPGFVDMHDLGDMLLQAGFADPVMDQETITLRWNTAEELLAELRSLGGNAAPERVAGLRTPRWRQRLLGELEALRGADGRLGLSFEVAYGHAFKAAPRFVPGGETTVSLQDMRTMLGSAGRR
jgi:malonyl-CoA O-methyltransferase